MSLSALKRKDGVRRARIEMYRGLVVAAAEAEFARHGYDDAKMHDIAQASGIALGTLYTVFPGKAEIYEAVQQLRGREILEHIGQAVAGHPRFPDVALRVISAYVRYLVDRPHFLQMHLRDDLSWTSRSALRTGSQVATWEQGVRLATDLLRHGKDGGFLHADNAPELQIKMLIAAHQVQLRDWLERGAHAGEVETLIVRMQEHFRRAFVREVPSPGGVSKPGRRAGR